MRRMALRISVLAFAAMWLTSCGSGSSSLTGSGSTVSSTIMPPTLRIGVVNVSYTSPAFTASGGSGSGYTFAVASGSLSPLSIGGSIGIISGTPGTAGTLQFAIKVTDSVGNTTTTGTLSIAINSALAITPPTLP